MAVDDLLSDRLDLLWNDDDEWDGIDSRVGPGHLVQQRLAAAGDDYLVAEPMEGFGQGTADSGGSAGDKEGIRVSFMVRVLGLDQRAR